MRLMITNENAMRALICSGDHTILMSAFYWESSALGGLYWATRYNGRVPISAEDIEYLRTELATWLIVHDGRNER